MNKMKFDSIGFVYAPNYIKGINLDISFDFEFMLDIFPEQGGRRSYLRSSHLLSFMFTFYYFNKMVTTFVININNLFFD